MYPVVGRTAVTLEIVGPDHYMAVGRLAPVEGEEVPTEMAWQLKYGH